jgi:hypothetical protein
LKGWDQTSDDPRRDHQSSTQQLINRVGDRKD